MNAVKALVPELRQLCERLPNNNTNERYCARKLDP